MPWTIQLLDDRKGLLLTARGTDAVAEYAQLNKDLLSLGEGLLPFRYAVVDLSSLEKSSLASADIDALASLNKQFVEGMAYSVIAIIAEKKSVFGVVRMWQILVDVRGVKMECKVVTSRREAEEWLRERMREKHGFEPTFT